MSGSRVDIESVDTLLESVQQSISTFKIQQTEKDRLAALKAAQSLVSALHPPKDNVYHLLYSVTNLSCPSVATSLIAYFSQ
jgi:hypothetical protein